MIVRKLLVDDGRTEREVLLVGTIVVGRDPACQLNDLDPLLSRRHAEFVSSAKGVTIRDLNSRNGILVNGDKVPEHALKSGDVIQVGHLHVRYIEEPVVKTLEDHTRSHAKTDTDLEVPTMAPVGRATKPSPAPPPAPVYRAATAPTEAMPVGDDPEATVAPVGRAATPPKAPARPSPAAPPADDPDATRAPIMTAAAAVQEWDVTMAPSSSSSVDETRAPVARRGAPARQTANATEARLVANATLVVVDASPSCQAIIGARPETLEGGQLSDALARAVTFIATGDGPPTLSLSIARAASGKTITVTFNAAPATEKHS
jgi:pSer/pThr/pTyr-binding forkhead associated (FHA) protein